MTERTAILILECGQASSRVMKLCLEARDLRMIVVESPAALVRDVLSRMPVAIVLGIAHDSALDAIEMIHAVDHQVPVIALADTDSIELERRAREAGVFYYVVEPLEEEEFGAVIDDVIRRAANP